jgi:hypothetical protein
LLLGVCLLLGRWIVGAAATVVATTIKKSITSPQGHKRPRGWALGDNPFFDLVEHYRGTEKRFYNYIFIVSALLSRRVFDLDILRKPAYFLNIFLDWSESAVTHRRTAVFLKVG